MKTTTMLRGGFLFSLFTLATLFHTLAGEDSSIKEYNLEYYRNLSKQIADDSQGETILTTLINSKGSAYYILLNPTQNADDQYLVQRLQYQQQTISLSAIANLSSMIIDSTEEQMKVKDQHQKLFYNKKYSVDENSMRERFVLKAGDIITKIGDEKMAPIREDWRGHSYVKIVKTFKILGFNYEGTAILEKKKQYFLTTDETAKTVLTREDLGSYSIIRKI